MATNMERDIRWLQRFDNYKRACAKLLEVTDSGVLVEQLSELEREGVIQRFEYTYELSWKVMQDYLQYLGFEFQTGPNGTIQLAFENGLISDHSGWRTMSKARITTSHTYDENDALEVARSIFDSYSLLLKELRDLLLIKEIDALEKDKF